MTIAAVKKAVRYWQIVSMVIEEGGEACTVNLCQQCCNEQFGAARQAAAEIVAMEKEWRRRSASWKAMEGDGK